MKNLACVFVCVFFLEGGLCGFGWFGWRGLGCGGVNDVVDEALDLWFGVFWGFMGFGCGFGGKKNET